MLFDDKKRDYLGRRLDGESYYEYLNRSGRNMCHVIRTVMEDWLLKLRYLILEFRKAHK